MKGILLYAKTSVGLLFALSSVRLIVEHGLFGLYKIIRSSFLIIFLIYIKKNCIMLIYKKKKKIHNSYLTIFPITLKY